MKTVMILLMIVALCSIAMGQSNEPSPSAYPTPYNPGPAVTKTTTDSPGSDEEMEMRECVYEDQTNIPKNYNTSFEKESEESWMNKFTPGRYFFNPFFYFSNFYRPFNPYYQQRWRRSSGSNYNNNPFFYNNPYSSTGNGWKRNTGGTPTPGTGPSSADDGKYYFYMEADDCRPGDFLTLYTKRELKGCFCVYFSYHLNVNNSGKKASNHTLTVKTQDKVLKTFTTPSDKWERVSLRFDTKVPTMIRIIATRGSNNHGDIAIDNIKMKRGGCNYTPAAKGKK